MKAIVTWGVLGFVLAGGGIAFGVHLARADKAAPSSMSALDAAKFAAAVARINEAQARADLEKQRIDAQAATAAAPHVAEARRIAALYHFDLDKLGDAVNVDSNTGAITRAAPPPDKKPDPTPPKTPPPTKK